MDVVPCTIDCISYPGEPTYSSKMRSFFFHSTFLVFILNSKSDFKDYNKPFTLATGSALNGVYDSRTYQKRKVFLKQIISETDDGVIFRDKRQDKGLTFKTMGYKQKPRFGTASAFGSVEFGLEKTVLVVQRRYPTLVDTIAKFGGLARVITFFVFSFVSIHHLIVMERYILNEAILQKRRRDTSSNQADR